MTEHHKGPPAGLAGTVDHVDAGDGWLIVRLLTKQALLREGEHMDHCLGDGDYEELAGDEDLTSDAIWSLRDPDGVSRATLDVRAGTGGRRHVLMAKGPRNRGVRRSDARRLGALVMTFRAAGVPLDFAGETRLVMADDGRVMREDQAPKEVRDEAQARHEARLNAGRDRLPECEVRVPMRAVSPSEYVGHIYLRNDLTHFFERARAIVGAGIRGAAAAVEDALSDVRTMTARDLRAGQWFDLEAVRVTNVTVTAGGEALRYGEDFAVDHIGGIVRFRRDVPGEVTISFRAAMVSRPAIPWTEEPLLSDRVAIGVDTQGAPEPGVQIKAMFDTLEPNTLDLRQAEAPQRSIMAPRYVMVPMRTAKDFLSTQLRTGPWE